MPTPEQAPPIRAPLPDVETERLDLRRFQATDLDELAAVFAHREVWQFPYGRGFSRQETQVFLDLQIAEWDQIGFGCWAARTIADGRIVGYVGLSVPTFLPEILLLWRLAGALGHAFGYETDSPCFDTGK